MEPVSANMNAGAKARVSSPSDKKRIAIASVAGSAAGIAAAVGGVYALSKRSNPALRLSQLRYSEGGMLALGAGSIAGGLAGGLVADKNKNNKIPKIREAIQQFFGSLMCPVAFVALFSKLLEISKFKMPEIKSASKGINNAISAIPSIVVTFGSLILGMNVGNKIVNKINNKIFNQEEKRDVKASDYLVHADDLCIAANLIFKDTAAITKVTSKILPVSFILAGTKTGMQEEVKAAE